MRSLRANAFLLAIATAMCLFTLRDTARAQLPPADPAYAQKRLALVIGNSSYRPFRGLPNATNDAETMARGLASVGFEVELKKDLALTAMKEALRLFAERLRRESAVGLLYFAGHGVQVDGINYLVPIDGRVADYKPRVQPARSVSVNDEILPSLSGARPEELRIVVLDACRDNPLNSRGLANIRRGVPKGAPFFIAYATSPEDTASDGPPNSNGPYVEALTAALKARWQPIDRVFAEVHETVSQRTGSQQFPWHTRSFSGEFYFNVGSEDDFWDRIKNSGRPQDFAAFLSQFPNGRFARNACVRKLELEEVARSPALRGKAEAIRQRIMPEIARCPVGVSGQNAAGSYVFPESSTRLLTDAEIAPLDCLQLWIARNEMFARMGYCFRNFESSKYFGSRGCTTSQENLLFSSEEQEYVISRSNTFRIRATESLKQCATRE